MEKWQREHIRRNLSELVKKTDCNVILISELVSYGVLGKHEEDTLGNKLLTRIERSKQLYDILETRVGAFEILIKALEQTNQTGALEVLREHNPQLRNHGLVKFDNNKLIQACADVKICCGQFDDRDVGVKVVCYFGRELTDAIREVAFLKKLDNHKNIVRYFFTEADQTSAYIALERCCYNLNDIFKTKLVSINTPLKKLLKQCVTGLAYLHVNGIIHRNLNPENVLLSLSPSERIKLSDFSVSQYGLASGSNVEFWNNNEGSGWMSPELLKATFTKGDRTPSNIKISFSSDIFSLGCIFYFILTNGLHPFGEPCDQIYHITHNKMQLKSCPIQKWKRLIKRMISHSPNGRPTAAAILTQNFGPVPFNDNIETVTDIFSVVSKMSDEIIDRNGLLHDNMVYQLQGKIKFNRYKILGKGNGTTVFQGWSSDMEAAVKVISSSLVDFDIALTEINYLKTINHQNIVQYMHAENSDDFLFVALELCRTNLQDEITNKQLDMLPEDVLGQATIGLNFLHSHGIVHGSLRPPNILINDAKQIKLSDFGLSKAISEDTAKTDELNDWAPPESLSPGSCLEKSTKIRKCADMFSLGCLFYYVLTNGMHPFGNRGERQYHIRHGKPQLDETFIDNNWMDAIKDLISKSPGKRPTVLKVLSNKTLKLSADQSIMTTQTTQVAPHTSSMDDQIEECEPEEPDDSSQASNTSSNLSSITYDSTASKTEQRSILQKISDVVRKQRFKKKSKLRQNITKIFRMSSKALQPKHKGTKLDRMFHDNLGYTSIFNICQLNGVVFVPVSNFHVGCQIPNIVGSCCLKH